MRRYLSMLRGLNVSGQKKIKMADLRDLYVELGFGNVETYIQSGNVVFESSLENHDKIRDKIESGIKIRFEFEVPVLVLDLEEIREAHENNPFISREGIKEEKLYVTFFQDYPDEGLADKVMELNSPGGEEIIFSGKLAYFHFPNGYGRSRLDNNFLERKLKTKATTRNWKTVSKLKELLEENKKSGKT